MPLTGRFRHRRTFGGRLVLQLEDVRTRRFGRTPKARWRDAKVLDLASPELRNLIDLGKRALFLPAEGRPQPRGNGSPELVGSELASADPRRTEAASVH